VNGNSWASPRFFYESEAPSAISTTNTPTTSPMILPPIAPTTFTSCSAADALRLAERPPRVGGRFTDYGETDGLNVTNREQQRWVLNNRCGSLVQSVARLERRPKPPVRRGRPGHIIEPSLNLRFVPTPNRAPPQLPQFDSELPSVAALAGRLSRLQCDRSVDSQMCCGRPEK